MQSYNYGRNRQHTQPSTCNTRNWNLYPIPEDTYAYEMEASSDEEPMTFIEEFGFDISLKPSIRSTFPEQTSEGENDETDVYPIRIFRFEEINGGECWEPSGTPPIPEDVVRLGQKIERIDVTKMFRKGCKMNVLVLGIYDPSKFWISTDLQKLENFSRDIEIFYKYNAWKYEIPADLIQKGLYCVASLHGVYSRAVILNPKYEARKVKLFFIDFGILSIEPVDKIWFLTQEFVELPVQAVRARLMGIRPSHQNTTWTAAAIKNFGQLAYFQNFTAEIADIDNISNFLWVRLTYHDEIPVTGVLATNGHVIFERVEQKKHIRDDNCRAKVEFIQHFPTFEHLENGTTPWSFETKDFIGTTVTMDFLIPQYFERRTNKTLSENIEKKMKLYEEREPPLRKCVRFEEIKNRHRMNEMNQAAYGGLFETLKGVSEPKPKEPEQGNCDNLKKMIDVRMKLCFSQRNTNEYLLPPSFKNPTTTVLTLPYSGHQYAMASRKRIGTLML